MPLAMQQVWIRNLTNQDIPITELGGQLLLAHAEVDITARLEGGRWYGEAQAALRALHTMPATSLYQALHSTPPKISVRVAVVANAAVEP